MSVDIQTGKERLAEKKNQFYRGELALRMWKNCGKSGPKTELAAIGGTLRLTLLACNARGVASRQYLVGDFTFSCSIDKCIQVVLAGFVHFENPNSET